MNRIKINEGIIVEDSLECLLCSKRGMLLYQDIQDRLFKSPGFWSFRYCPECELAWLNPRPIKENAIKLYANYYTHEALFNSERDLVNLRKRAKAIIKCLKSSRGGHLLDVGCGNGWFLKVMLKLGWKVTGVERDEEAVRLAKDMFGLEVIQGTLDDIKFPPEQFEAITINHVIEHVHDPIKLLAECRRILKSNGIIVIATPNLKSLTKYLFGQYWRGWDVPRHLFLFSPKSLRICVERSELRIKQVRTSARGAHWMWTTTRLTRRLGFLPSDSSNKINLWLKLEGLMFKLTESGLCLFIKNIGEEILLVAMK
ncbi:MAG: class I SAM-dependent methyltransferase [Candidatus Aminicenantes bacterium]|nr:class I SAM-dependent methyltransferase [Candidatus Aminicenantes bacterium]